eukprot:m.109226 g.109226  ORF g.109226 m.109226 type:complete len:539 (+) comp27935_c0_seq1:268-1884(+)
MSEKEIQPKKVVLGPARPPPEWADTGIKENEVNNPTTDKDKDTANEAPIEVADSKKDDPPVKPQSFPSMAWSSSSKKDATFKAPTFEAPAPKKTVTTSNKEDSTNSETDASKAVESPQNPTTAPTEATKSEFPEIPYKPPSWSAPLKHPYRLEVLKNGAVIEEFILKDKPYFVVGRLPNCDIVMEHESASRYHAILQCGDDGHVYIYDLGSTHGTKINKNTVVSRKHFRLRMNQMARFGLSSRLFLLQGTEESMLDEQLRLEDVEHDVANKKVEEAKEKEEQAAKGASWGMDYELEETIVKAEEAEGTTKSLDPNAYYLEDPKKALRVYFEREAAALNYEVEQDGPGHARVYTCRIRLPVDSADGDSLTAEASVNGKKKDAILEAALIACKMLDSRGVLRNDQAKAARKAKREAIENVDNSDDDTFYDRSGQVEAKKRRKLKKHSESKETFASLSTKKESAVRELKEIQAKQTQARLVQKKAEADSGLDPLDAFISGMSDNIGDDSKAKLKKRERVLQHEIADMERLLTLVAPTEMPT